jgi:hypothetical protein
MDCGSELRIRQRRNHCRSLLVTRPEPLRFGQVAPRRVLERVTLALAPTGPGSDETAASATGFDDSVCLENLVSLRHRSGRQIEVSRKLANGREPDPWRQHAVSCLIGDLAPDLLCERDE